MVLVVERQRPEAVHRRRLVLREGHRVAVGAVEPHARRIEVLIEILRLVRRVDEDVGFGHRRAGEVVGAEGCFVGNRAPMVRKLLAVVAEFEQRLDQLLVGVRGPLRHRRLELRIALRRVQHREHLRVARLLARQRRRVGKRPPAACRRRISGGTHTDLLLAGRGVRQFLDRAPIDALHRAVVLRKRVHHDLAQHRLDRLSIFRRVVHEDARRDEAGVGRGAEHLR